MSERPPRKILQFLNWDSFYLGVATIYTSFYSSVGVLTSSVFSSATFSSFFSPEYNVNYEAIP